MAAKRVARKQPIKAMEDHVVIRLARFIDEEQKVGDPGRHTVSICNAFAIVSRYRHFLEIVLPRHAEAAEGLRSCIKRLDGPSRSMTPEEMDAFADMQTFNVQLQLEAESFYVFAKILLDRVAHSIEHYFGPARGVSMDSHDDFVKFFTAYVADRGLMNVLDTLPALMRDLKARVSGYRDYQISHEKSPRSLIAMAWTTDGKTTRHVTRMNPKPNEQIVSGEPPETLLALIDEYLIAIVEFVRANRSARRTS
jgi:hypothetical protein